MSIKTVAIVGFNLGVACDEVTEPVRAYLIRDILQLVAICPQGKSFQLHMQRGQSAKFKDLLDVLAQTSSTKVHSVTYSDPLDPEVDCWLRYIVKEKVHLVHEFIYDRDFRVVEGGQEINDREVYPVSPPYAADKLASPQSNPMNRPMPNPYAKPWFQFAKKR